MSATLRDPDLHAGLAQISDLVQAVDSNEPGARESLIKATRRFLHTVESPTEQIWRMLWSEPTHHVALRLAVELNLFTHLQTHGQSTVSQLSTSLNIDPILLRRICQHLAAMGTLVEPPSTHDTYVNTPMSSLLAKPEYAMSVKLMEDLVNPCGQLSAIPFLKSRSWTNPDDIRDSIMQHYYGCKGQTFFEWGAVNGDPPMVVQFGQMLQAWSQGRYHWMDEGYYPVRRNLIEGAAKRSGGENVFIVDVGGSDGHDLVQLKAKFPYDLPGRLVLQDMKLMDEPTKNTLAESGIEAQVYDFFTTQPVKGSRAYYMHSVLHDWSDKDCKRILKQLILAMEKGYSKLLVQEMVVPERDAHWQLTSLDWNLMITFGQKERREVEWRELIEGISVQMEGEETERSLKIVQVWKHAGSVDSLLECELA